MDWYWTAYSFTSIYNLVGKLSPSTIRPRFPPKPETHSVFPFVEIRLYSNWDFHFSIFCMAFKKVRTFSDSLFLNRGEIGSCGCIQGHALLMRKKLVSC